MGKVVTQAEFARIRGRSPPWVDLQRELGMPHIPASGKGGRVQIDTEAAIDWLIEQEANKYRSAEPQDGSHAEGERRLVWAKARKTEMENQIREGELFPADHVEQAFSSACVIFRSQVEGLSGRLAGTLADKSDPAEIRQIILDECRRICQAAADRLDSLFQAKDKALSAEAAAE